MSNATHVIDADLDMMANTILNAKVDGYYSKDDVDALINSLNRLELRVEPSLPATGEEGYIYLVPSQNPQATNARNEYVWIANGETGSWELIGTTEFHLNIDQSSPDEISIDSTVIRNATEAQSGLMTKEMVQSLSAKQDALTPGLNISIVDNVISASTGGADKVVYANVNLTVSDAWQNVGDTAVESYPTAITAYDSNGEMIGVALKYDPSAQRIQYMVNEAVTGATVIASL